MKGSGNYEVCLVLANLEDEETFETGPGLCDEEVWNRLYQQVGMRPEDALASAFELPELEAYLATSEEGGLQ